MVKCRLQSPTTEPGRIRSPEDRLGFRGGVTILVLMAASLATLAGCEQIRENVARGPDAIFAAADIVVVKDDLAFAFEARWHTPGVFVPSLYMLGFEQYLKDHEEDYRKRFGLKPTDRIECSTHILMGDFRKPLLIAVYDGEYRESYLAFEQVPGTSNTIITEQLHYISLRENQARLKTGFTARIDPIQDWFTARVGNFYDDITPVIECLPVTVFRMHTEIRFGKKHWEIDETERPCAVPITVADPDYICFGLLGLRSLAADIGKQITKSEYPFVLRLS